MLNAIELFFTFWIASFNFLFNDMAILPGITIGNIMVSIIVIIAVIGLIIAMPKGSSKKDE